MTIILHRMKSLGPQQQSFNYIYRLGQKSHQKKKINNNQNYFIVLLPYLFANSSENPKKASLNCLVS